MSSFLVSFSPSLSLPLSLVPSIPSSHGFIQKTSRSSIRKVTINWLVSRQNIPHFGRERFFLYNFRRNIFTIFDRFSFCVVHCVGELFLLIFNFRNENVFFEWNRYATNWYTTVMLSFYFVLEWIFYCYPLQLVVFTRQFHLEYLFFSGHFREQVMHCVRSTLLECDYALALQHCARFECIL